MYRLFIVLAGLVMSVGCDPSTIVTTNVTTPTSPSPVNQTNPVQSCPTCPITTQPTCPAGYTCSPNGPVNNKPPEILSFGSDTQSITHGGSALLRWEVSDPNSQVRIDPGVGSVGSVGFTLVFPTVTTTYTLTARNNNGTVQRMFTVVVTS